MNFVSCDANRKGIAPGSENAHTTEQRPVLGVAGKSLLVALASMTKIKSKGESMHVHLRVSHEMYQANRGDPHHHHISSQGKEKSNNKKSTSKIQGARLIGRYQNCKNNFKAVDIFLQKYDVKCIGVHVRKSVEPK